MEAPPPYRAKKSNTGLIIGLIIGGVFLCCLLPIGGLVGFGYWGMKAATPMMECLVSTELLQRSVVAYAADNGGKLPNAETWQDQIRPYYERELGNEKLKQNPFKTFPASGPWGCEVGEGRTTLTFNSALSGKKLDDVKDQGETILFFESPPGDAKTSGKYDPASIGAPPKRFPTAFWMIIPVSGDPRWVGKGGEAIKDEGKMKGSFKFDF